MVNPKDILLDDNMDVKALQGDFEVNDATFQNQQLLLISEKGEWKQSPVVGVGIMSFLLDDVTVHELHQEIQKQFNLDGMKVNKIEGNTWQNTIIDADYV